MVDCSRFLFRLIDFVDKRIQNPVKYIRSQPAFNCSKLTIETLEQGVKYVQSLQ